jgi:hypothetical protein
MRPSIPLNKYAIVGGKPPVGRHGYRGLLQIMRGGVIQQAPAKSHCMPSHLGTRNRTVHRFAQPCLPNHGGRLPDEVHGIRVLSCD